MADRRHWTAGTGVGLAAAALLMTCLTTAALGSAFPGTRTPSTVPVGPHGALGVPYAGAFTDSGRKGVERIADLQDWLGGTPMRVGHTYLPGGNWDDIEGDRELLEPWAHWRRADPSRLFVLNVPMQEHNEDHLDDSEVRSLIEQGASGDFDEHFTRLAERLVEMGVPDTVIVLGWEMNGITYAHRCGPDPEGWKAYWNRIVTAMRAVPGQNFRFDFAPSRGRDDVPWTECYPGDGTVDIIGMDSYDQPPGESFSDQVDEPYGLQEQVDFAARHGKAISYPEWGLSGNGDDPEYVTHMLRWMSEHKALYQTVTDYCPHGVWQCSDNPRSSKVFRAMLHARTTQPLPWPTEPTTGPTTAPPLSVTATSAPSPSATPSATPTLTVTPAPSATPSPAVSPTPIATPTPAVSPSPSVSPSATPSPPATPRPAVTVPTTTVPTVVPAVPTPSATRAAPPGAAPVPKPSHTVVECMPLELTGEMKKQYASGKVCFYLTPKARK